MKFLLDENMPPSLAAMLQNAGHEARHVFEIGYNNTPDFQIAAFAASTGETILTHDTDFGTILALLGGRSPSVVLFRWQRVSTLAILHFVVDMTPEIIESLHSGALIVVDEHKVRIRALPLQSA